MSNPESGFNPQEYTRLAKQRALELLKQGDFKSAIDSMVSDLSKDPSRSQEQKNMIVMMGMATRNDQALDDKKTREFIEGFAN